MGKLRSGRISKIHGAVRCITAAGSELPEKKNNYPLAKTNNGIYDHLCWEAQVAIHDDRFVYPLLYASTSCQL